MTAPRTPWTRESLRRAADPLTVPEQYAAPVEPAPWQWVFQDQPGSGSTNPDGAATVVTYIGRPTRITDPDRRWLVPAALLAAVLVALIAAIAWRIK